MYVCMYVRRNTQHTSLPARKYLKTNPTLNLAKLLIAEFVIVESYSSNKDKIPSKKERKKERKKGGKTLETLTSPTQNSLFNYRRWLSRGMTFRI